MAPLPYPYTFGAKIKSFPWKFHYNNFWLYRAWGLGFIITLPIMYKIQMATGYGLFGEGERNQEKLRKMREAHH